MCGSRFVSIASFGMQIQLVFRVASQRFIFFFGVSFFFSQSRTEFLPNDHESHASGHSSEAAGYSGLFFLFPIIFSFLLAFKS